MTTVTDISAWMEKVAPLELSESWDNTGLLLGDPQATVQRVLTCLTLTPETVGEAVAEDVDLVIAHHPLPFKPVAKITTETIAGQLLWSLARAGVSVYSPHTAWDSAELGINAQLARMLALNASEPLRASEKDGLSGLGAGRLGNLQQAAELTSIAQRLGELIPACRPRGVDSGRAITCVAIACGSGGSLLPDAARRGCDLFVTGEATFHTCLEAQALGISLLMIGHFASERFSMQVLADALASDLSGLNVWSSRSEKDPVRNLV